MTPDVNVLLFDFKRQRGREMVVKNEDGSFTILINSRLSHRGQLEAYHHAMSHIENNDFEKTDVQTIETAAHETEQRQADTPLQRPARASDLAPEQTQAQVQAQIPAPIRTPAPTGSQSHKLEIQTPTGSQFHKIEIPPDAEVMPAPKYLERLKELRKQRKKTQRQLRQYEEDTTFLERMGAGLDTFARGEHWKLYGNDL